MRPTGLYMVLMSLIVKIRLISLIRLISGPDLGPPRTIIDYPPRDEARRSGSRWQLGDLAANDPLGSIYIASTSPTTGLLGF